MVVSEKFINFGTLVVAIAVQALVLSIFFI